MKANIVQIWQNNPGQIFFIEDSPRLKNMSFVAIPPRKSEMICDNCKVGVWNASNLMNDIHFCVNKEMDITFSPLQIKFDK